MISLEDSRTPSCSYFDYDKSPPGGEKHQSQQKGVGRGSLLERFIERGRFQGSKRCQIRALCVFLHCAVETEILSHRRCALFEPFRRGGGRDVVLHRVPSRFHSAEVYSRFGKAQETRLCLECVVAKSESPLEKSLKIPAPCLFTPDVVAFLGASRVVRF